jgi:hypothetical protein
MEMIHRLNSGTATLAHSTQHKERKKGMEEPPSMHPGLKCIHRSGRHGDDELSLAPISIRAPLISPRWMERKKFLLKTDIRYKSVPDVIFYRELLLLRLLLSPVKRKENDGQILSATVLFFLCVCVCVTGS